MPSTRRSLLLAGLGVAAAGASGCTIEDPRIDGPRPTGGTTPAGASPRPSPTPTPTVPGTAEAATVELRLAGMVASLTSGRLKGDVEPALRQLLVGLEAAHLNHAAALLGPEPTARATDQAPTPRPVTPPSSLGRGLRLLVAAQQAAAERHRRAALATSGFTGLLFGSLSVAAGEFSAAVDADPPGRLGSARPPRPMPVLSDVEAMSELVRQLHAAVYGYQMAIGQLKVGSSGRDRAVTRLQEHRVLRDRLTATLIKRAVAVPVAEPAYVPAVRPRDPRTSGHLIRHLEVALLPFCGLWLASVSSAAERSQAIGVMSRTAATGRQWGAPITAWPGWT